MLTMLDPSERLLVCHFCGHPLSPQHIQQVIGLDQVTQQRMERGAIEKLKQVARDMEMRMD